MRPEHRQRATIIWVGGLGVLVSFASTLAYRILMHRSLSKIDYNTALVIRIVGNVTGLVLLVWACSMMIRLSPQDKAAENQNSVLMPIMAAYYMFTMISVFLAPL